MDPTEVEIIDTKVRVKYMVHSEITEVEEDKKNKSVGTDTK